MRSTAVWISILVAFLLGAFVVRKHLEKPIGGLKVTEQEWPLPDLWFWKQRAIIFELGLNQHQIELLLSYGSLNWTEEEEKFFPFRPGTDFADQAVKVRRLKAVLSDDQFKRFRELEIQSMGVLSVELPAVAKALGLSNSQQKAIQRVKEFYEAERQWITALNSEEHERRNDLVQRAGKSDLAVSYYGFTSANLPSLKSMEKQTIRGLLTPDQLAKLDRLKGEPASVVRTDQYFSIFNSSDSKFSVIRNPDNWEALGLAPDSVPKHLVRRTGQPSKLHSAAEEVTAVAAVWQTLSARQKATLTKMEIPFIPVGNAVLREDLRVLLGISEFEQDRMVIKLALESKFSDIESAILAQRNVRYYADSPEDVDSVRFARDGLVGTGQILYTDRDSGVWSIMRPETRAKWMVLGGKPPQSRRTVR